MRRHALRSLMAVLAVAALLGGRPVAAANAPININTASATELTTIKGIGPAKAQAIVEHREKNGQFKSVDDLKLVRGIGDKMIEQLRTQVTVEGGGAAPAVAGVAPAAAKK